MDFDKAITEVKDLCDKYMAGYKMVSMRSALYDLGYPADQADVIIRHVADRGFSYCLDHTIPCTSYALGPAERHPAQSVCVWGPDQLKDRLECLRKGS